MYGEVYINTYEFTTYSFNLSKRYNGLCFEDGGPLVNEFFEVKTFDFKICQE